MPVPTASMICPLGNSTKCRHLFYARAIRSEARPRWIPNALDLGPSCGPDEKKTRNVIHNSVVVKVSVNFLTDTHWEINKN